MSSDKIKKTNGEENVLEFDLGLPASGTSNTVSSSARVQQNIVAVKNVTKIADAKVEMDPLFRLLAEPKLPLLPKADRAKLQMQSPTRIYFYWSIKNNPVKVLNKALGGQTGSYTLVAKLRNMSAGTEELFPVDASGNWWFDVDADSVYRAEIGFYAPNRPYVRIVYSNELRTPRKSPSRRTDYTPSFAVNAQEFAKALDAAGYKRDAFDVALAGDNFDTAQKATSDTYRSLSGKPAPRVAASFDADLRFVLLALAAGYTLEEIKPMIDSRLFELIKRDLENVSAENAMNVLKENFDVVPGELEEYEEIGERVFGASLVNFPRRIKKRSLPTSVLPRIDDLKNPDSVSSLGKR